MPYSHDALLQHDRPRCSRGALLHPGARSAGPRRRARLGTQQALLRPARAAPNRQDVDPAGTARLAQQRQTWRLPVRVRERRGWAGGAGRYRAGDAGDPRPNGDWGSGDARRRLLGADLACRSRQLRTGRCIGRDARSLGGGRSETSGRADRRDRRPDRRHAALRAAPAPGWLRAQATRIPTERCAVRRARCARLPDSLKLAERCDQRRQRLQHQGQVVASG